MVDNFDIIRKHLDFKTEYDRYIIHILKRAKDDQGVTYGVNETNRLIKTFYITSLDYFDKKIPVIKDLCDKNLARAYILPQVRNNEECLKELLKIVVDNLSNPSIKPDHLIRSAYCGYHGSRDKKWILDLDDDNMTEYRESLGFPHSRVEKIEWTPEKVLEFVQNALIDCKKSKDDAWMIPTRHGHCIVTSSFDLNKAHTKCNMFYQGVAKKYVDRKDICIGKSEPVYKDINGWIIKDGMALLFMS